MSQRITIEILDKIATCLTKKPVVCGNSDYVIDFLFDEEWNAHDVKTAVFVVNGQSMKQVFTGNVCEMPVFQNTLVAWVGVFAGTIDDGTLSTSTPALVKCKPSITDGDNVPAPPKDDVYNQIVGLCEDAVSTAKSVEERANNGEFNGKDYVLTESDINKIASNTGEKISAHDIANNSHNDIRLLIIELTSRLNEVYERVYSPFDSALEFVSARPFTIGVNHRGWDGTMEYFNGIDWTTWNGDTISSIIHKDKYCIYIRGTGNTKVTGMGNGGWNLTGTAIECNGNIENLLDYASVKVGKHPTMSTYCYTSMFDSCTSLISAPYLPAEILTANCYQGMFAGCTNLITAPIIGAIGFEDVINSANSCDYMFYNCTSLVEAPELKPVVLATSCYFYMFYNCTSLKVAPSLPATTLAHACYCGMFKGCTSLETAPAIQAEAVPSWGCCEMFSGCTSLKSLESWSLPSAWVDVYCYENMFRNCVSLEKLPYLMADTLHEGCYKDMFNGCTNIRLSKTQINNNYVPYRIPTMSVGTEGLNSLLDMFKGTGGSFTGTPTINVTYYLRRSNAIV